MKKFIIITTIHDPSEAIRLCAKMKDHRLIVVGDQKTSKDWSYPQVEFLPVSSHEKMDLHLTESLPYNHYSRKMIGYLYAVSEGADQIIDLDDDILPKKNWSFPLFEGSYDLVDEKMGFVNVYTNYTSLQIWPRGLPLQYIPKKIDSESKNKREVKVGIWQGLSDESPDVDAIYRLTINANVEFNDLPPLVLGRSTISPYNSQNTCIRKELFSLLYLPATVSFRFTDILRSLVAQPIMWLYDYLLGFTNATTTQKRNPHDHFEDFILEIPMYTNAHRVLEIVDQNISARNGIDDNLMNAYEALHHHKIVDAKEIQILESWLKDLNSAQ